MTSSNGVCHWTHFIIQIKFGDIRMRNDQVITLSDRKWAIFAVNQWAVTLVMMSSNEVCNWSHVIIHIKFGDDRMKNDQVITHSDQKWAVFDGNQWAVTRVMTSSWHHQKKFVIDPMSSFFENFENQDFLWSHDAIPKIFSHSSRTYLRDFIDTSLVKIG